MARPFGVTLLSIFYFLGTCFLILAGLGSIFGMSYIGQAMVRNAQMGAGGTTVFTGLGIVLSLFFFAIAALDALVGYGLWSLRSWGHTMAIILSAIGMAFSALGITSVLLRLDILRLLFWGICLGINLLIFRYLRQPQVKQAFDTGTPTRGMASAARA